MNTFERRIDTKLILSIIAVGIMSFSGVVVETAMNITFPTLMQEFGVGMSTVQWITTAYLLVLSMIIPTSSWMKRRFTNKQLFTAAISLFLVGTILAAAAPVFGVLLLGRLIQGIGTGIALPLMFNIVLEQVPYEKMGFMMGVASLITAIAPAVGPSLGGILVTDFGWRMIFIVLIPLLVLAFFLGVTSIRQVSDTTEDAFPVVTYLLLAAGFSCFIFAINRASYSGWASVPVMVLFGACILCTGLFCRRSLQMDTPLLNVRVFGNRAFSLSLAAIVLLQFICLGMGFLIPNDAQLVLGKDAFVAGCILLPGCILGAALTPFSGRILDRFGAKPPILFGNAMIILSTVCFCLFLKQSSVWQLAVWYLFFACGQGCSVGNLMTSGLKNLPDAQSSDGNAVINTLQQLAGAAGTSVVSTIVASAQAASADQAVGTQTGTSQAFLALTVLAVVMFVCSFTALQKKKASHEERGYEMT